jgi:hypothetical protein
MPTIFSNPKNVKGDMKKLLWCLPFVLFACTSLEDAKPEQRNSFAYFYGSDQNTISVAADLDADGIVMIGFKSKSLTDLTKPIMVMIKTDLKGKNICPVICQGH